MIVPFSFLVFETPFSTKFLHYVVVNVQARGRAFSLLACFLILSLFDPRVNHFFASPGFFRRAGAAK
jgi:hypothetical protein